MRQFRDREQYDWTIDLNFGAVLRVKSLSDGRYDLLKPEKLIQHSEFDKPVSLQAAILLDLPTLWEVLFMVVEPEAKSKGISAEQFAARLSPEDLIDASEKFREEWRDFFRGLQRPDQATALEKMGVWMKAATRKLNQAMEDGRLESLDRQVMDQMDRTMSSSFGSLQAHLDSTREATPGGSSKT